jgi:hypothetical protein
VTLDDAIDRVLTRLSDGQIETLAAACATRPGPSSTLTQLAAGVTGPRSSVHLL